MPERKVHVRDDKLILGREYPEVHAYMDRPSKYLGRRHRVVRHDLNTALIMLLSTGDPKAAFSVLMHIVRDTKESRDKRR